MSVDQELKTYLLDMESRINARFDMVDARFGKVDARFDMVGARLEKVDARFDKMDARFDMVTARFDLVDARIDHVEKHFSERIEATETRLLTEFWKYARESEARMRRIESSDATIIDRMGNLSERVSVLERKLAGHKEIGGTN